MVNAGDIQPVQQQISNAQHIGKLLFFDTVDGVAVLIRICGALDALLQLIEPADDKTTGAAGKVGHGLANLGFDDLGHKVGDSTGRIELTSRTGALQLFQNGLVNLTEGMALLIVTEIQLVNDIEHLPQQHAILHVLIGIGKGGLHNGFADRGSGINLNSGNQGFAVSVLCVIAFQHWEQRIIDEIQQLLTGEGGAGFIIMSPIPPAAFLRDDGLIFLVLKFPVLLLCVVHLQKQHPRNLLNTLCVTVNARIVAHDIAQPFYKSC